MLDSSTPGPVTDLTLRTFFGFALVASLFAAMNLALIDLPVATDLRALLIGGYAAVGLGSLFALRLPREAARRSMLPLMLASLVVVGSVAMVTGWGLRTPGLYFFGIFVCMSSAMAPLGQGLAVTASAMGLVILLALAERHGLLRPGDPNAAPLIARTFVQVGAIACGAAAGWMLARLTRSHVREATDREERFRRLLGIAAVAYWETDADLRVSHVSRRNAQALFMPLSIGQPRQAWDIPELSAETAMMQLLRERMLAREPLRDVLMRWAPPQRPVMLMLISGEPQFGSHGRFLGYWGVARDVTAEHRAREALLDTEMRYRDLFRRTPTPMVLHRDGTVVDANEAAASMFGYRDAHQMLGASMAQFDQRSGETTVNHRLAQLRDLPSGEALPLADLQLTGVDGRQLAVKATAVRADFGGQSALLSIYIDETSQRAATLAQQRSEALLRQVVTMSPDVITLTELETGRYEMVNESFYRVTGYSASEVLGHTSAELGIWASPQDRDRLWRAMESNDAFKDVAVDFLDRRGRRLPMLVSAARFTREGRHYLVINGRDMSDANRDRLEREAIMANASVGLAQVRDRHFAMVNPRFEQMYGWPPGQLVGQSADVLWARREDYDQLGAQIGDALRRGEQVDIERDARRHDGTTFLARLLAKAVDPQHPVSGGTIWIAEDVTAQRQAQAELARARDAAEAANRAKSAFLANTSHEIRTPLNGLVGLARLARRPNVEPARLQQYLSQIADSAETLSLIISDILDLSKIEAGHLQVEAAPFSLMELLQSLQHAYAALADSRDLGFSMDLGPQVPDMVLGDAMRVRQILSNFLHNALKFTPSGTVGLTVRVAGGDRVRFEVSDSGPGIDEATQALLFQPFTQADESITRRFGGTGLGLSICRELATLMNGSVGLQSAPGQGSRFHVELPLPALNGGFAASGHTTLDMNMLSGARVLLVEDNAVNMMIGIALLEQWGVSAESAEDGAAAIAAVERSVTQGRPFDAVLMDVQMPGMGGHEATRRLRQRWSKGQLPIIALTAAALVSEREQALASGMNDFVTKPIEPNRLRQALLRALADDD
ncbi:MAG: PAS domain S-box protein [Ideonella sp.]|nr:PAS domain S-box protein [Ideonella sp.]